MYGSDTSVFMQNLPSPSVSSLLPFRYAWWNKSIIIRWKYSFQPIGQLSEPDLKKMYSEILSRNPTVGCCQLGMLSADTYQIWNYPTYHEICQLNWFHHIFLCFRQNVEYIYYISKKLLSFFQKRKRIFTNPNKHFSNYFQSKFAWKFGIKYFDMWEEEKNMYYICQPTCLLLLVHVRIISFRWNVLGQSNVVCMLVNYS